MVRWTQERNLILIFKVFKSKCPRVYLGGDWRHFAHLVGIGTETIQFWRRLGLRNPMDNVLSFWKDSHVATVLALHRILITDQVGAMSLAKLVSEFYHVD